VPITDDRQLLLGLLFRTPCIVTLDISSHLHCTIIVHAQRS
jgi:hypothetical protein